MPAGHCAAATSSRQCDTTVQPKNISFPDRCQAAARRHHGPQPLGQQHGVRLQQSYVRVARQRGDDGRALCSRRLTNRQPPAIADPAQQGLGRLIRDIGRKIAGHQDIEAAFAPRWRAPVRSEASNSVSVAGSSIFLPCPRDRVHRQGKGQRALRVRRQGLHRHHQRPAPRAVSSCCNKARCPATRTDGHTDQNVIDQTQKTHRARDRARLYRQGVPRTNTQNTRRIFISGQRRGVFGVVKRERCRRRSAIEPVIGHLKAEGHLGRCYPSKAGAGDAANAILSAVGYNFRRILAWLRVLLRQILKALLRYFIVLPSLKLAS